MSMTKSASRSTGAATSSVNMVVPLRRVAPNIGMKPLRMSHSRCARSPSPSAKSMSVAPSSARIAVALATSSASASGLSAETSTSMAGEVSVKNWR